MKNLIIHIFAATVMVTGLASLASSPASAASSRSTCSDEYQAAKAAGTLNGQKWPQFLSACTASLKAGAATPPAAPTTAKVNTGSPGAMPSGAAANAGSSASAATTRTACSDKYQAAKTAGTLNGQKWPQFYSACAASLKAGAPATPAAPTTAKLNTGATGAMAPSAGAAAATAMPSGKATKAGASTKPQTEGQIAEHARIKECGVEWKQAKTNGTLKPGENWPQFWSACNTRLKSQG